jgi:CheY-like chemotaxis protein
VAHDFNNYLTVIQGSAELLTDEISLDSPLLPAKRVATLTPSPPPQPRSDSAVGGDETILVAEDEVMVRSLVVRHLIRAGYRVVEADDVPSALAAAKGIGRLDLLVTDVTMPSGTGLDPADALRSSDPELRVLYVSGYPPRDTLAEGDSLLQKPFSKLQLLGAIRASLAAA